MVECRIPGHITGLYIFAVVNLCALLNISLVSADVFVIDVDKNSTIDVIQDKQAMFGPDFPAEGLVGRLVYVIPHDACNRVTPPPPEPSEKDLPWIALIKRGPCHFDLKVLNAQRAGYSAVIVHNYNGSNSLMPMGGDSAYADKVKIPSVFVGFDNGMALAHRYNYTHKSIVIKILESSDQAPASFFLPFVVVVSICFLGVVIFSIIKCVKYFQHIRRTRLSKSALKKIPTRKYMKGDHYDTCAICLEDYEEGEKLRVLPCDHTYHCKCIDPWLTKRKKTCPQCKRRVIPGHDTDSDSDEEEAAAAAPASETTPLLGGSNNHRHQRRPGPSSSGRQSRPPTGQQASVTPDTAASPSDLPAVMQPEVVVINEGRMAVNTTTTTTTRGPRADDSSSTEEEGEEEMEGAVGGVGISDRKDFEEAQRPCITVEVEPSRLAPPIHPGVEAAVEQSAEDPDPTPTLTPTPTPTPSPVGEEGSINGAFLVASGSSEEDNPNNGSGSGRGGKKKRNKQRKNNQVV